MSCCGKGRQAVSSLPGSTGYVSRDSATFEYVGRGALSVIGGATGRRYEFTGSGAQVRVDPRDRPSLMQVSRLRLR